MRLLALLLLLANLVYGAWSQSWLAPYGWAPKAQGEPERLSQQVNADDLVLVDPSKLAPPVDTTPVSLSCLMTPELTQAERDAVQTAAKAILPEGSWTIDEQAAALRFDVYMGPYASQKELDAKSEQLKALGLGFQATGNGAQSAGLSLGSYTNQAQAEAALKAFVAKGVRSAKVLPMASSAKSYRFRLPAVDVKILTRLPELASALPGQGLIPCQ